MCQGYDPQPLLRILSQYLKAENTLLEIGMGPGNDFSYLSKKYKATGSDLSHHFLSLYKEKHKDADLLSLDAISLKTEKKFDCIFSNKVLMHLEKDDLKKSIKRQYEILNAGGLIFHSFWKGSGQDYIEESLFQYYLEDELLELFDKYFKVEYMSTYKELEDDDSILMIMRKK